MPWWTTRAPLFEVRVRRCRSLAATALLLALVSPFGLAVPVSQAGTVAAPVAAEPATVEQLVAAVQSTYKAVTTIRADFTQSAKNPMTGVEEKLRGRIALERPRKMRIEFGVPMKQAVVSDGVTQWLYSADQKQVIVQKDLGGSTGVAQLLDDLGRLGELFNVTMAPASVPPKPIHVVTLKPKQPGGVKSIELGLTKQKYVLQDLTIIDATDSTTKMSFTMVWMNGDIPDVEFNFKAPVGTTVVQM